MTRIVFPGALTKARALFLTILGLRLLAPVAGLARALGCDPTAGEVHWVNVKELDVEGKGWADTRSFFDRLPARAEKLAPPSVWGLSHNSAGLCVRFQTDAPTVEARWSLLSDRLEMDHMPATGVSGLDLYVKDGQAWRWVGVGRPSRRSGNTSTLVSGLPKGRHEFLLYLPLYNGVTAVELGVPEGHAIEKAPPRPASHRRPIVFYGTSITQGGCASRPGAVHTAILGRRFERPVINLGFSGSGRMEGEMGDLIAELDPAVFVLDCLPNMNPAEITARVEPFVRKLRAAHPHTPIVLAEDRSYSASTVLEWPRHANASNRKALREAAARLAAAGVGGLTVLPGDPQLGDDGEGTVDGSHPTDLGFARMADAFAKVLGPLLQSAGD